MVWPTEQQFLECQTCGSVVKKLTSAEAQRVADSPYDYVVYCGEHRDDWKWQARRDGLL